jgi:hypothetical protein
MTWSHTEDNMEIKKKLSEESEILSIQNDLVSQSLVVEYKEENQVTKSLLFHIYNTNNILQQ